MNDVTWKGLKDLILNYVDKRGYQNYEWSYLWIATNFYFYLCIYHNIAYTDSYRCLRFIQSVHFNTNHSWRVLTWIASNTNMEGKGYETDSIALLATKEQRQVMKL